MRNDDKAAVFVATGDLGLLIKTRKALVKEILRCFNICEIQNVAPRALLTE